MKINIIPSPLSTIGHGRSDNRPNASLLLAPRVNQRATQASDFEPKGSADLVVNPAVRLLGVDTVTITVWESPKPFVDTVTNTDDVDLIVVTVLNIQPSTQPIPLGYSVRSSINQTWIISNHAAYRAMPWFNRTHPTLPPLVSLVDPRLDQMRWHGGMVQR